MPTPDPGLFAWSPSVDAESALGTADYSYEFVLRQFLTALGDRCSRVRRPEDAATGSVLMSFAPPHRTPEVPGVRVIPVFAWEFDRLPDEQFGGDPQSDWRVPLARCGAAITHSSFAVEVTRAAMGSTYPVVSLPAPLWDAHMGPARAEPPLVGGLVVTGIIADSASDDPADAGTGTTHIKWRGPTFTAVLNPEDGRKNWPDLVSAFVFALRDRSDATLVIKVVHRDAERGVAPIAAALRRLGDFACRVVLVQAFLPDADYRHLVAGSTFAVNASRGEGQCLPLMEFMSAGVPAIAPDHTAMADYVSSDNAFVVPSGREPSAWPQDPRLLFTCHRRAIDWGALVAAYRSAYRVATTDPAQYSAMSAAAIAATRSYCSIETVLAGLDGFLQALSLKGADD